MRLPKESPWSSQRAKGYQMKQVIETRLTGTSAQPQLTGSGLVGVRDYAGWEFLSECRRHRPIDQGQLEQHKRQYLQEWLFDGEPPGASLQDRTGRKSLLRAVAQVGPCVVAFR